MHFDQRTQAALREAGLSGDEIREASKRVVTAVEADAERLSGFFADRETVFSDMEQAHSQERFPEHDFDHLDLYTHAADIRGYLEFSTWGVPVEGGRILSEDVVELSLGPTVHGRVRFAATREALE